MKRKIRLAVCGVLALALLSWATPALAVPPIPHAFYGTVTINGPNAPVGTVVSAKINGVNAGSYTTTVAGQYGNVATRGYLAVSCDGANDGDTITFYVTNENGTVTGGTATFAVGGGPTEKNLSVNIDIPFEPAPPGGGGAPPPAEQPPVETNIFGTTGSFEISDDGEVQETFTATSEDGNLTLTIPEGTIALDKDGEPLEALEAAVDESPPDPPEGAHIMGAFDFGPDGATFDPPITLTWNYDPEDVPENMDLVIAYYDEDDGEWVHLPVERINNTLTVSISHFTTFALIAVPKPAAFTLSSLIIEPTEVAPGENVNISISVANTGGTEGSYTVVLDINDVKEAEKSVTVAADSSQAVSFSVTKEEAGSYDVAVDGLSGSFTVVVPPPPPEEPAPPVPEEPAAPTPPTPEEVTAPVTPPPVTPPPVTPTNWPMIGGIIAAVIVAGLIIFFLVRRRAY